MYSIEEIQALAKTVADCKLQRIKLKTDDCTLIIEGAAQPQSICVAAPAAAPAPAVALAPAPAAETAAPEAAPAAEASGNLVKAPLVGTFYAAASPDEPPYVKIGDTVKKGDVLMIIESMKLMNEVQSEFDGVVQEIYVANGDAVEYDQPLMRIC